jgi:outer membrane protein
MSIFTIEKLTIGSILLICGITPVVSQEVAIQDWDLNRCISYALDHNIQVSKKKLTVQASEANYYLAKSERLPNLNATVSQSFANSHSDGGWRSGNSTSAAINSSMTLYAGGSIMNGIRQSELEVALSNLDVETTRNSITLAITQAYLNTLYAKEAMDYYREVVATSERQVQRTRELLRAGSVARYDLAQIEAEYASNKYALVQAQNTLAARITALKQLLEIPVRDTFSVFFPELNITENMLLPSKGEAFDKALSVMPEVKGSQVSKRIAEVGLSIAKSGYLPRLSLNAGYSTGASSRGTGSFGTQLNNGQNQQLGFSLSVPIFNRNSTKVSVQKSLITLDQAELSRQETEKNLLQEVEAAYQNVENGLSRYQAARVQVEAAGESYRLAEEQFNLGMLNAIQLLNAKSSLLNAKKELIQSKYNVILSQKILDFYMGNPISL